MSIIREQANYLFDEICRCKDEQHKLSLKYTESLLYNQLKDGGWCVYEDHGITTEVYQIELNKLKRAQYSAFFELVSLQEIFPEIITLEFVETARIFLLDYFYDGDKRKLAIAYADIMLRYATKDREVVI